MELKKNKDMVVYKNEFNTTPLRNFNPLEMDLLFTIMSRIKDQGEKDISFTFYDLKKLSKYSRKQSVERFVKDLESVYDKLLNLHMMTGDGQRWVKFVLFTKYSVDLVEETIEIKVNEEFSYLINAITGNFTKFELEEFISLRSGYAKAMYRLLKQYRLTGYAIFKIDDFRNLLDIPDSYSMSQISTRVLKPIDKELSQYFKNFKIRKIYGTGKLNKNIVKLEFTFKPEDDFKKGSKVFRDIDGNYYKKGIMDINQYEINKAFPEKDNK